MSFYAVGIGRAPGIYEDWKSCQAQVQGFSRAAFKKFKTRQEADEYVKAFALGDAFLTTRKRKAEGPLSVDEKHQRSMSMEVYTDGNCDRNGQREARAGSGVYFMRGEKKIEVSSGVPGDQTNGRAEIYALAMALNETLEDEFICIRPDSEYVAKGVTDPTWLEHWHKNGWRTHGSKRAVANVDLWQIVVALLEKRRAAGRPEPQVKWVKAHAENPGNEAADKLADVGMSKHVLKMDH